MRAINWHGIRNAYRRFLIDFALLLSVALLTVFSYFFSVEKVYENLQKEAERIEKITAVKLSIIYDFDFIATRMKRLARFGSASAEEVKGQRLLLRQVQLANRRIEMNIASVGLDMSSFRAYKKLSDQVVLNIKITDSLFKSYYELERASIALRGCKDANKKVKEKLAGGRL